MCPPLFGWLVGKSELTEGVVDVEVSPLIVEIGRQKRGGVGGRT